MAILCAFALNVKWPKKQIWPLSAFVTNGQLNLCAPADAILKCQQKKGISTAKEQILKVAIIPSQTAAKRKDAGA